MTDQITLPSWEPDVVFYHAHCKDGFGAAWAMNRTFPDAKYVPVGYATVDSAAKLKTWIDENALHGKRVMMLDFSLKREPMRELCGIAESIVVLDHHKTAEAELLPWIVSLDRMHVGGVNWEIGQARAASAITGEFGAVSHYGCFAWFDMNRSGAVMAWDFCSPRTPAPRFLRMIEDRDLWRFQIPGSKDLHAFLNLLPDDFTQWSQLLDNKYLDNAIVIGQSLTVAHMKNVDNVAGTAFMRDMGHGVRAIQVNAPYFLASDLGAKLLKDHKAADFAIIWSHTDKGCVVSFRSLDCRMDVSKVAARLGGGGHRNAAGATVSDMRTLNTAVSDIIANGT